MRYFGTIGFLKTVETEPDIWTNKIVERQYYGDITKKTYGWKSSTEKVNDDLTVNVNISILADDFITCNFSAMRYVEYMGVKWKILSATPERPRITLELGGVWNGEQT